MDLDGAPGDSVATDNSSHNNNNNNNNNNSSSNNNTNITNNAANQSANNSNTNNNRNNTNVTLSNSNILSFMATSPILKTEFDIDVIRLIGQHLTSLGLSKTVGMLLQESGLQKLDHPLPDRFKEHVLVGEWEKATALVDELANLIVSAPPSTPNYLPTDSQDCMDNMDDSRLPKDCDDDLNGSTSSFKMNKRRIANAIRLAIAEQKFLEHLEDGQHLKACRCLRLEISPYRDVEHVQHLTKLLMCRKPDVFRAMANWPGKGMKSRQMVVEKIQRYIPPFISLPPRRLTTLLHQAVQFQKDRCILHIPREDDYETTESQGNRRAHRARLESSSSNSSSTSSSADSNNMVLNGSDDFTTATTTNNNSSSNLNNPVTAQRTNGHAAATSNTVTTAMATATVVATTSSSLTTTTPSSSPSSMSLATGIAAVPTCPSAAAEQVEYVDLKQDHICAADRFPLASRQQIDGVHSEVWFCQFSPDGEMLATGGHDGKVHIWKVDRDSVMARYVLPSWDPRLRLKCTLDGNGHSVTCLSWSPRGTYLLVCGSKDRPDLTMWNVETQSHTRISLSENESATTCSWHKSDRMFAAASIKGNFHIYDQDGNRLGSREGVRVQCLSFLNKDPRYILAADTLNRIKAYSVKDISLDSYEEDVLEEQHPIMSFVVDKDDRYIAVNLMGQGVHLWDYKLKTMVRIFSGVIQRYLTIFSSFSGLNPRFLASGSEDGKVYIYNVNKDQPVVILRGHSKCVNCVAWNPKYPEMLVSVSDDRTIRLWASKDPKLEIRPRRT